MVGLLDLPLELREPILLGVVLDTIQQQPEGPLSIYGEPSSRHVPVLEPSLEFRRTFCRPLQRHASPLLLINHQIRNEVTHLVLQRLGQRINDAKLDFVCMDRKGLWATWLSAPFPATHLHTVNAQVRNFTRIVPSLARAARSRLISTSIGQDDDWQGERQVAEMMRDFLANFLRGQRAATILWDTQSARSYSESGAASRTIQNLVIDLPFESDPRYSPREPALACHNMYRDGMYCMLPFEKRTALLFARSLHAQMLKTFGVLPRHGIYNHFPDIVFEGIGVIDIRVGGVQFRTLDVGQLLAELPHSEDWLARYVNRSEFFKLKRIVEEKRKAAGFRVMKRSNQEHEIVGAAGAIAAILAGRDESLVDKAAALRDDTTPPRQPKTGESVAFMGKTVFVRNDGTVLSGQATFYSSDLRDFMELDWMLRGQFENHVGGPRSDVEVALFKSEAIFIGRNTITSGDATFYGRAKQRK
ncbi:hypothetical protein J7T55_000991 [Diaporthe amygdali]|uniref:uncharacterized protein n=1 Tax=Phomopsis amygdali TaxID=1214568 RepID=UPI0022FED813|nr:uncharacterized protein J7T55_000991 [Diaporthe amygdali]KAJ0120136.1 hypothetical protein J7T55_000991 [Diaporthe amygdali]